MPSRDGHQGGRGGAGVCNAGVGWGGAEGDQGCLVLVWGCVGGRADHCLACPPRGGPADRRSART